MKTIGGIMWVHNGIKYDYCFEQTTECLAMLCDTVIVADCQSRDGTWDALTKLVRRFPHIQLIHLPWSPNFGGEWQNDLANTIRVRLGTDWWFHLEADEIVDPCHMGSLKALTEQPLGVIFNRINIWPDAQHFIKGSHPVASDIVRMAPIDTQFLGDGCQPNRHDGTHWIDSGIPMPHYGFIRKPMAFFEKATRMESAYYGKTNPILERVKTEGMRCLSSVWPSDSVHPYYGGHIASMKPWLRSRGYQPV